MHWTFVASHTCTFSSLINKIVIICNKSSRCKTLKLFKINSYFNKNFRNMEKEEIKQVFMNWKNAIISGDLKFLEQIYDDNFFWINSMGISNNKTEILNRISSNNLSYLSWINEDISVDID